MKHVLLPDVNPSWARRWHDLLASAPLRRGFFREALDCGFFMARPSFRGLSLESGPRQFLSALIDWIRGTEPGIAPDDIGLDAIFFCHTPAAHLREPVRALAEEVRAAGYRCLVWHDNEREVLLPDGEGDPATVRERLEEFWDAPLPPGRRIAIVLRALLQAGYLTVRLGGKRGRSVSDLGRHPGRWWAALVDSGLRMQRAASLLDATSPSLLFTTHERFRPASSFWLTRHRPRPTTVLYHHGLLSWYEQPLVSDEILTWNRTDAEEVRAAAPHAQVHITGNWELGRLGDAVGATADGPPELLFLSQYLQEDEPCFRDSSVQALTWLREVARRVPSWKFLVRPRGPEDEIVRRLGRLPSNIEIVDVPFADLLARPGLRAVTAFSSSGLYVAAGRGKRALRLRLGQHRLEMPLLDEVCTPIWSADELARVLNEELASPRTGERSAEIFPDRAIARASAVCLAKLASRRRAIERGPVAEDIPSPAV